MALLVEVALQRRGTDRRQLIRLAPIRGRQRLNQTAGFQPGQNFVECAGSQVHSRKAFDVLGQRLAVLGSVRQAGQHEGGRAGVTAEPVERLVWWHGITVYR